MKKEVIACIVSIVIGIILVVTSLTVIRANKTMIYPYSGKAVFSTESEYRQFKTFVANEKVIVRDIGVLSSEPPIVVTFLVRCPQDMNFPYGNRSFLPNDVRFAFPFVIGIVLIAASVFFLGFGCFY